MGRILHVRNATRIDVDLTPGCVTLPTWPRLSEWTGALTQVPTFSVEVVSTLGAGDVFHGALVAALADDHPLPDAVRRANATAALSCRVLDGRGAIPTLSELNTFLASQPDPSAASSDLT